MFKKRLALTPLEIECQVRSDFEPGSNMCPATPATSGRSVASLASRFFLLAYESALNAEAGAAKSSVRVHPVCRSIEVTLRSQRCGADPRPIPQVVPN